MSLFAISRILCAVDLSGISRHVLRQAMGLARQHGAAVRVICVIDPGSPPSARGAATFEITPEMRATVEEDLQWLAAAVLDAEVEIDTCVREGRVATAILDEAGAIRADVVVIGTHGRRGVERLALGSVAETIVRTASCPVLVVPPAVDDAPVLARVVVCPTDFSPAAKAAVIYARFMAQRVGSALSLVTVTDWPFGESPAPGPVADLMHGIDAEAQRQLEDIRTDVGIATRATVLHGKPWQTIVEFARGERSGLIVMGATGRATHRLGLLGSTTYRVVRDGVCPVLVVPAEPRT